MAKKYLSTLKVSAGLFSAILIVLLANGLPANAQTVSTEAKDQGLQISLLISSPSTEAVMSHSGFSIPYKGRILLTIMACSIITNLISYFDLYEAKRIITLKLFIHPIMWKNTFGAEEESWN